MHQYVLSLTWTGNQGTGTTGYRDYDRSVTAVAEGKLAQFCDVFVEAGAFTADQGRRVSRRARDLGLGIKLHVDPYLEVVDTSGTGDTTWYVFADPAQGRSIQNGRRNAQ